MPPLRTMTPVNRMGHISWSGARLWSPAQLTSLAAWYEADPAYCWQDVGCTVACGDGDPICTWQDRSGNSYHITQSDILKRPTLRLVSGKWCVRFDGVNDYLTKAVPLNLGTAHAIVIAGSVANSGGVLLWDILTSNYLYFSNSTNIQYAVSGANATVSHGLTAGILYLLGLTRSGTAVEFWKNGSQQDTTQTLAANNTYSWNRIADSGGGNALIGDVCEILSTLDDLSDADRQSLFNYINTRLDIY